MLKRKGTCSSVDHPFDILSNKKRVPWRSSDDKKGDIDCSSPDMLIQSMLGNTKVDDFFNDYWEKKPLVVRRADPKFYGELFTLALIKDVVQVNEFDFLIDVNVGAYVSGLKKEFVEERGKVTVEVIDRLMDKNKATFQFYHPQRYIDELWNILEKMESYFGCLVTGNAYITPPGCQGSAPHCDDVENFIFQIEGKVKWEIYKPMVELCRDYTQDLPEESLGEPILEVSLEPGDLLYFPRGLIYQCQSTDSSHSTHIQLSTYQQNTWGDFMAYAVQQAIENALEDDVCIRSGLPINYQSFLGTAKNMSAYVTDPVDEKKEKNESKEHSNLCDPKVIKFKESIQSCLSKLVNHVDINKAADSMCAEFMDSRLPPYGHKDLHVVDDELAVDNEATSAAMDEDNTTPVAAVGSVDNTTPVAAVGTTTPVDPEAVDDNMIPVAPVDGDDNTTPAAEAAVDDNSKITPAAGKCGTTLCSDVNMAVDAPDKSKMPTIDDKIKIKYPNHIRVVYVGEDEDDDESMDDSIEEMENDENVKQESEKKPKGKEGKEDGKLPSETYDDDDEEAEVTDTEPHIKVQHSLYNDRFSHMGFNVFGSVGCLKFDVTFAKALVGLMNASDFIAVKDLLMEEDEEKVLLATRLAGDGLLEVRS